ncbi:TetR family transcriptional regulator [uncultured Oscillibacter sp.]|uniref:TetR family transcriptional regulator n=1 Tax=uncultured Oscillibacter sp. TaxID=876091 RepID=UPI0025F2AE40|nr:TetR family transcriptional regulator [uncultured Oscillibacter sp.]
MPIDMKSKIAETLSQMLRSKPLDKITVKELVDACGISRQTFYYHFQDIMDVVEWNQQQSLRQAIESSLTAPTNRDAIRGVVREAVQRRDQIRQLLSSQRSREIEQLLIKAVGTYLREMLLIKVPEINLSSGDVEAALCFYSCGLVGMMLSGLENRHLDVDVLADQMLRLLTGEISLRPQGAPGKGADA